MPASDSSNNNDTALLIAQLNELSQRERVSAAVAFPAVLVIVWAHRAMMPTTHLVGWLVFISAMLLLRLILSRYTIPAQCAPRNVQRLRNLRILIGMLYGIGWGAVLIVLDTGKLDFLYMLKIATLAAVLGVTVNAMSVVLPVYLYTAILLILSIMAHVLTAAFLQPDDRIALIIGLIVYGSLLMIASVNISKLTRFALEQGFAREAANERLNILARQDALTGGFNRRHLLDELGRQTQLQARYGTPFSIILLDLDHFKQVNDTLGHQVGDQVLIGVTRLFEETLREIDVPGRWGGEEFLCILPNTPIPEALCCAERLRAKLEAAHLVSARPELTVTASFGIGTCQPGESIDALIQRVDALLYQAKAAGRNRVKG